MKGKIILTETHDVELVDPIVEIAEGTIDNHIRQTFQPKIVLIDRENELRRFAQILPEQPYVKGTWTNKDVQNAVKKYLEEIAIK